MSWLPRVRLVRSGFVVLACVGILWSAAIWLADGLRFEIFSVSIRATNSRRPLILAGVVLGLGFLLDLTTRRGSHFVSAVAALTRPAVVGRLLAAAAVLIALFFGSAVAGGSDSFGYLSQAELWLRADLHIDQPSAVDVPWPAGQRTFTPLGYGSSPAGDSIVPTYPPGFPILLALFKKLGGQCAINFAVPLSTGLLIATTFAIGRQVGSPQIAVASAWLMTTSPIVLWMSVLAMSDIPAALFWTLAVYCCLQKTWLSALWGGLAAAVAILVRPNLVFVALLILLWLLARGWHSTVTRERVSSALAFAVPVTIGAAVLAVINQYLYGSPTRSGYGDLAGLFSTRYVLANLMSFSRWIAESQTPFGLLGFAALWLPIHISKRRQTNTDEHRLLSLISFGVVTSYLFYLNFDAWWYLRFLLPCWPAMCFSVAHLVARLDGRFSPSAIALLGAVGLYGLGFSYVAGFGHVGHNEQRYVTVARLVRDATPPNSVVLAMQHSGSLRYYGGRLTLRYDTLDEQWLDRAIDWLAAHGHRPYVLLDEWEHERFTGRFAGANAQAKLALGKVFEYRDSARTSLYDLLATMEIAKPHAIVIAGNADWWEMRCAEPDRTELVLAGR